ncbi:NUDIX domain-containing protein [Candidatus Parcubacteria bacterium]|nr:NUDIX domain-containing protein [Candidatus Parcubacteria bacterium]
MKQQLDIQVGVKALLKNKKGQFLMLKRSEKKYTDTKGRWDIVGGRILPGTELMENLKREIMEEIGLQLIKEPILIAAQDIIRADKHVVRLTYLGVIDGKIKLDTEENSEYKWLTLDEIRAMPDLDIYLKEVLEKHSFT